MRVCGAEESWGHLLHEQSIAAALHDSHVPLRAPERSGIRMLLCPTFRNPLCALGPLTPPPPPRVQRMHCPTNTAVRTVIFWSLVDEAPGVGTELRTACPTNSPVQTVFFEDFTVRWTPGGGTLHHLPELCAQFPHHALRVDTGVVVFSLLWRAMVPTGQRAHLLSPPPHCSAHCLPLAVHKWHFHVPPLSPSPPHACADQTDHTTKHLLLLLGRWRNFLLAKFRGVGSVEHCICFHIVSCFLGKCWEQRILWDVVNYRCFQWQFNFQLLMTLNAALACMSRCA